MKKKFFFISLFERGDDKNKLTAEKNVEKNHEENR